MESNEGKSAKDTEKIYERERRLIEADHQCSTIDNLNKASLLISFFNHLETCGRSTV